MWSCLLQYIFTMSIKMLCYVEIQVKKLKKLLQKYFGFYFLCYKFVSWAGSGSNKKYFGSGLC